MSYRPEVVADDSGKWAGNQLRFRTREEAELYAVDLSMRWILVREWRVVESEDPATYEIIKDEGNTVIRPIEPDDRKLRAELREIKAKLRTVRDPWIRQRLARRRREIEESLR